MESEEMDECIDGGLWITGEGRGERRGEGKALDGCFK